MSEGNAEPGGFGNILPGGGGSSTTNILGKSGISKRNRSRFANKKNAHETHRILPSNKKLLKNDPKAFRNVSGGEAF